MKCSNHPDAEAVGFCTNCGKSVCSNCSMTIGGNLTCKSCFANMSSGKPGTPAAAPVPPVTAQAPPAAPVVPEAPKAAPAAPPVPPVVTQAPIIPPVPPVSASSPPPNPAYNFSTAAPVARKEPILSLILSGIGFFLFGIIGLGQAYNGQIKKAVILSVGNWVLWIVVFIIYMVGSFATLGVGSLCCLPLFIVPVVLWFYAMYDAYVTADKLNKGVFTKDWLS